MALIQSLIKIFERIRNDRVNYDIDEENKLILEFELERFKEEVRMRSGAAAESEAERMSNYRNRARQALEDMDVDGINDNQMMPDMPLPNQPVPPNPMIGLPNPFANMQIPAPNIPNPFANRNPPARPNIVQPPRREMNSDEDSENMSDDEPDEEYENEVQPTFAGTGHRLGGEENQPQQEEDSKEARLKWLEKMQKK